MQITDAHLKAAKLHPAHILMPFDALLGHEGVDAINALCDVMGGATVYIPTARRVFAACIEQQMILEFNGYNYNELARKYGYSSKHVRRLLSK